MPPNNVELLVLLICPPKSQKWHYSESLSKYASSLGQTGFVGSVATESAVFRPRHTAGKKKKKKPRLFFFKENTKQNKTARCWVLSKSSEGGDLILFYFSLSFHQVSWKCFSWASSGICSEEKALFQSLPWKARAAGRRAAGSVVSGVSQ